MVNVEIKPEAVSVEESRSELNFTVERLDSHTIDPQLNSVDFIVLTMAGSASGMCADRRGFACVE